MQADYWPSIYRIARAFDEARRADAAIAEAWDDRMERRRASCRSVVERLADAAELDARWTVDDATRTMLWALTSMRTWEDLVIDSGWTRDRYVDCLSTAARRTLLA